MACPEVRKASFQMKRISREKQRTPGLTSWNPPSLQGSVSSVHGNMVNHKISAMNWLFVDFLAKMLLAFDC